MAKRKTGIKLFIVLICIGIIAIAGFIFLKNTTNKVYKCNNIEEYKTKLISMNYPTVTIQQVDWFNNQKINILCARIGLDAPCSYLIYEAEENMDSIIQKSELVPTTYKLDNYMVYEYNSGDDFARYYIVVDNFIISAQSLDKLKELVFTECLDR